MSLATFAADKGFGCRVARWFLFKPKIPILVHFGRPRNGKCRYLFRAFCNILHQLGIFYGPLVYFLVIWHISPVLVCFAQKNLATLNGCWRQSFCVFSSFATAAVTQPNDNFNVIPGDKAEPSKGNYFSVCRFGLVFERNESKVFAIFDDQ
jgi:hypothetical protein